MLVGDRLGLGALQRTVIVAMIGMRVVEVALDEIIDVIAVRHRLVAATGSVLMSGRVPAAAVLRGAVVWMVSIYRDRMLVDMIAVHVMEIPVIQIAT